MFSLRSAVPLAALALATTAAAQPRVVPLDEALALARAEAIPVLRASAQVDAARDAVDGIRDARWPSLSLGLDGGQRYGLAFDQTSGALTQASVQSVGVGVNADVVVFDGFERRAQTRSAEAAVREAELTRARAEQEAQVAVLQGYLAVALAEASRTVALEDVAAQQRLLDEVRAQVEFGERPAYEVSQQEERVATAQAAVLAAERDAALARARLVRALGLDPAADYAFPTPDAADATPLADTPHLVVQALEARDDLRAAGAAISASEADARADATARLPRVSVGASFGTSYTSAADFGLPGQFGDNRSGGLRVGVSVPLFDRGVTRHRVRQAEIRTVALRAEREDARRAVALEVQERTIELQALAEQVDLAAVRVRAATEALAAERDRFQAGVSTLQAVTLLQARAVEARTAQERLGVEARFQRRLLSIAVGE